jgi:tetratricopeptide (TPR) repeat protein
MSGRLIGVLGAALLHGAGGCAAVCIAQAPQYPAQQIAEHQRKAQAYLQQKKPALAIPELKAIAALDPGDMEVRANLGVLLFFQGQYAEAVGPLKAAVESKPELWKIRSLLGTAERRVGDDREGRADLEATFPNLRDDKLKIEVGRELIESYAVDDEFDKAANMIGTLLKLQPTNPALLYISYRIHSQMATAAMLELGLTAPDSAQTHQAMAHELQRDRNLPATIANLREALRLDPALPGAHFELAEALHASDDQRLRSEAEAQYKLAVETNPSDPKAAERMGDIQVEKEDLTAGIKYYQQALKLQPGNEDAAIGLANVLFQQGKTGEALALLQGVEKDDPTNSIAHYRLSAVYRKLNRPEDVRREIDLYKHYKEEREKLESIYQQMRVTPAQNGDEK